MRIAFGAVMPQGGTTPSTRTIDRRIREISRARLGHETLQPGQAAAMRSVVSGRDTLAVMPTGAGKSAIYQVCGALLDGPTIVISPLIALQRDQAEAVEQSHLGRARYFNSSLSETEREDVLRSVEAGEVEYLLLAPEQLARSEILDRIRRMRPSLVAVDEAHCVSDWGHDFRPEYLQLARAIEQLGRPTVLALTATASPPVRDEIVARLGMRDAAVVVRGFDRPNIWLGVEAVEDEAAKRRRLIELVGAAERPGIVYAATRRRADSLAQDLRDAGVDAASYHAGLRSALREELQGAFMEDRIDVIVATTAFGMGVDKPNVRFVFHADVADSVEAYYQELGRAGRDGEPAAARLLYRSADLGLRRFFAAAGHVEPDEIRRVAEAIRAHGADVTLQALRDELSMSETKLTSALSRLSDIGLVELLPDGEVSARRSLGRGGDLQRAADRAAAADERHRQFERSRVEMMRAYAETRECRRRYLLNYFGEEAPAACASCDSCEEATSTDEPATPGLSLNASVRHRRFGRGRVVRHEGGRVVVLFEDAGYKTLRAESALERGLLERIG